MYTVYAIKSLNVKKEDQIWTVVTFPDAWEAYALRDARHKQGWLAAVTDVQETGPDRILRVEGRPAIVVHTRL